MKKYLFQILSCILIYFVTATQCIGKTIVFYEKYFPSIENGTISRSSIEQALISMNPIFVGLDDLKKKNMLAENDLLVLPYGSAFPAGAWDVIQNYLAKGNLLVLGGRPFFVPVYRDSTGWRAEHPQIHMPDTLA